MLFLAVTVVAYILFFIIPADPAKQFAGKGANADTIAKAKAFLGLDDPIYIQYLKFLKRLVIHQDLGFSWYNREDVNQIIMDAAPVTASLVLGGAFFWLLLAIPIGVLSALRPRSPPQIPRPSPPPPWSPTIHRMSPVRRVPSQHPTIATAMALRTSRT